MRALFRQVMLTILVVAMLGVMFLSECVSVTQTAVKPKLAVDPKLSGKPPGETFSVDITVTDVAELFGWQFNMSFNPAVLQAVSAVEGPFLKQAGKTIKPNEGLNNITGWIFASWNLFPIPERGASGSGVLATVTFEVVAEGKSVLAFVEESPPLVFGTKMRTWGANLPEPGPVPLEFESIDGAFGYPRDLAVTRVTASSGLVLAGEVVVVNVTVENAGYVDEIFNVTSFYGANEIGTQTDLTLESKTSKPVSFNWDTTGVAQGTYNLRARVTEVADDVNVTNNEFVGDSVTIGLVHDIAITNVTAFPISVNSGEKTSVVVTVFNKGSVTETFQVTLWYGANVVGTQSVSSLVPGGSWALIFTLDAKDVAAGGYVLTAMTTMIPGETETEDNTLTDVVIQVREPLLLVPFELLVVAVVVAVAEAVIGLVIFMYLRRKGKYTE